jgi:8-oxo-dGTP pyrophosphatase MutT (NUDIX family)
MSKAERLLRLLPAPLHHVLLTAASRLLRIWRRWSGHRPPGCAMIVHDHEGKVLLVRHSYIEPDTWMLPSGRLGRGEPPLSAAAREVHEEVDIDAISVDMIEYEDVAYWGIAHQTYIVGARTAAPAKPDGREIIAAKFFDPEELPENTSLPTVERLKRWRFRRSLPVEVPSFVRPDYVASPRFSRRRQVPRR